MAEPMEFDRTSPEMVRAGGNTGYPNKKHCTSPRKGSTKTNKDKKMDKTIYREQSDGMQQQQQQQQQPPPPQHRHLEPMNIPLGQGVPPASGMPPHHLGPEHHVQQASRARHRSVNSPSGESAADKKTRGRVRIRMEFISNKLRRYTTFSKRKTGIMKKAYELSTLTGTQVMLLVASETGHVYTFATPKLQPMITSETGKALIQTCLNSPDPPPPNRNPDERMSQTGYEETELAYPVNPDEVEPEKVPGGDERHMYNNSNDPNLNSGSPPHSFTGLPMPHGSFPMNMSFIPATTKGDSNNNISAQGYTVQPPLSQQQLGNFGAIFPPHTSYSTSPQNMPGTMSHAMSNHMVRMPGSLSPSHSIDIGNMVTLQRNPVSTQPSVSESPAFYSNSPRSRDENDSKHDIKQHESDGETRDSC